MTRALTSAVMGVLAAMMIAVSAMGADSEKPRVLRVGAHAQDITPTHLPCTFNVSLANGDRGYMPTPEQHALGGYSTWIRRMSMGPEVEPLAVETELQLLEEVSGEKRKNPTEVDGPYAHLVMNSQPVAYYRLGEFDGDMASDHTGHGHDAKIEPMTAHYLRGPGGVGFCGPGVVNRCIHFATGCVTVDLPKLGDDYSVEMWFWNGFPNDARAVTCYLFSRGPDGGKDAPGAGLLIPAQPMSMHCPV